MKVYRAAPAGARAYLEADCARADDYYLSEETGLAQRYTTDSDGHVRRLTALDGQAYEAWVAGLDPDTGEPKGRLRNDDRAVRFVEVTVNGPKSWSLAAELHPDIAVAYAAAQDRAAGQVIGWLGQHATARVGPRGAQIAVPVDRLEAVTVRHYTSRAGDPHRHLHLQVNARVWAGGEWRGLDTVGFRDSLGAINGIGHAAVVADPAFRTALAAHGYTLAASGEITQLAPFVGAFSKRAKQIERNLKRYEKAWRAQHPGEEPGRALRRGWDSRAWAQARPDKMTPTSGQQLHDRWLSELAELGYRDVGQPTLLLAPPVGGIDRDRAVRVVLARLASARSAWNAADLRGEVEQLLARAGIVADPAVRGELAEDLTARALAQCVPLLERPGVPEHIRALTSPRVLAVEQDVVGRLAVRGAEPGHNLDTTAVVQLTGPVHDAGQAAAVAALAGDRALVVIEGTAGAGKTTLLAATREHLTGQGHRLIVVTPTLKAAQAASAELGAPASSAAKLAHAHGWRWDQHGTWTRLRPGDPDPQTGRPFTEPDQGMRLQAGDLVVCDEAGMLDQDTARALLVIADEHRARVALIGDRHQLAAVGRGGVLEHAARWAEVITVDVVHRFVHTIVDEHDRVRTVPDVEYAQLTRAMRAGEDPGQVFDALHERGQIRLHADMTELHDELAEQAVTDRLAARPAMVLAGTREQVAELNTLIREAMITAGLVDDRQTVTTLAGDRIGAGDVVATRRNNADLDVANRDTWTVTRTHRDGRLTVTSKAAGERVLPADYVQAHVELAYASTVHGAQGSTTTTAQVLLDEHSTAAGAYVAMTRGREANTAHLIAASLDEAREQWITTFGRDRADLGPAAARLAAEREASRYAVATSDHAAARSDYAAARSDYAEATFDYAGVTSDEDVATSEQRAARQRPAEDPARLRELLEKLPGAWTEQARAHLILDTLQWRLDQARAEAAAREHAAAILAPLDARRHAARTAAQAATEHAAASRTVLAARAEQLSTELRHLWDTDRPLAAEAARTVHTGAGRLHQRTRQVRAAQQLLDQWATNWRPVIDIAAQPGGATAWAACAPGWDHIEEPITSYAHTRARAELPGHAAAVHTADTTRQLAETAAHAYTDAYTRLQQANGYGITGYRITDYTDDSAARREDHAVIARLAQDTGPARDRAEAADRRVEHLTGHPALTSRTDADTLLATAHSRWDHDLEAASHPTDDHACDYAPSAADPITYRHHESPDYGHSIDHSGPSIGR